MNCKPKNPGIEEPSYQVPLIFKERIVEANVRQISVVHAGNFILGRQSGVRINKTLIDGLIVDLSDRQLQLLVVDD